MDIIHNIMILLKTNVIGHIQVYHILSVLGGTLFPVILGMVLPRKRTIHYGMLINKTLGLALLQKRVFKNCSIPNNILANIILTIQTTFQDVSFGVYLDSRKDITDEEKNKRIEEYIKLYSVVKKDV